MFRGGTLRIRPRDERTRRQTVLARGWVRRRLVESSWCRVTSCSSREAPSGSPERTAAWYGEISAYKQDTISYISNFFLLQGRDHTIHAAQPGYVRYYRDPARHPKRKYIGVVFEKTQQLPTPANAVRRRKLGMLAFQVPSTYTEHETADLLTGPQTGLPGNAEMGEAKPSTIREEPNESRGIKTVKKTGSGEVVDSKLTLRPGYQYRKANWEIGRDAMLSKAAQSVKPFIPGDRFAAWRKRNVRVARNAERRAMGRGGKKGSKK